VCDGAVTQENIAMPYSSRTMRRRAKEDKAKKERKNHKKTTARGGRFFISFDRGWFLPAAQELNHGSFFPPCLCTLGVGRIRTRAQAGLALFSGQRASACNMQHRGAYAMNHSKEGLSLGTAEARRGRTERPGKGDKTGREAISLWSLLLTDRLSRLAKGNIC